MDEKLKHRIVGGVVLASVAVIVIPMMFSSDDEVKTASLSESVIPPNPQADLKTISVPVVEKWSDKSLSDVVPEPIVSSKIDDVLLDEKDTQDQVVTKPASKAPEPAMQLTTDVNVADEPAKETKPKAQTVVEKKKPEPKPELVTESAAGKAWVVQVGSFSERANAERLRNKLIKSGYRAFVMQSRANNRNVVRVRVGPELVRANADKLRAKLEKELNMQTMVVEHR